MQVSSAMEKLAFFPQDSEMTASYFGIVIYLRGYEDEDGHTPRYYLDVVDVNRLPWMKDPTWFEKHRRKT